MIRRPKKRASSAARAPASKRKPPRPLCAPPAASRQPQEEERRPARARARRRPCASGGYRRRAQADQPLGLRPAARARDAAAQRRPAVRRQTWRHFPRRRRRSSRRGRLQRAPRAIGGVATHADRPRTWHGDRPRPARAPSRANRRHPDGSGLRGPQLSNDCQDADGAERAAAARRHPRGRHPLWKNKVEPFTERQIDLVTTFADQAVIAIENVRLFEELRQRTGDLSEALERQTATSEVLQVISTSPGELEPVFQTCWSTRRASAKPGSRRCGHSKTAPPASSRASAYRRVCRVPAAWGTSAGSPGPLSRLVETRQVVHVHDYRADQSYLAGDRLAVSGVELAGIRTLLIIPEIKDGELIGAISIFRQSPPFSDKQIELLGNFASRPSSRSRTCAC